MSTDFTTLPIDYKLSAAAIVQPRDGSLLFRFRRAAQIEFRLLILEDWIETNRQRPRAWTIATLRMQKLIQRNLALKPFGDVCHGYLLAIFEGQE